jgi:LPXTG-motif cell wall-anchored protein
MRVPRRLLPLLACALIAGTPAVAHAQGGAGDDQYQDPFGGSNSGGGGSTNSGSGSGSESGGDSSSGSTGAAAQDSGSAPELTQDPDLGTSSSSTAAAPAAPATSSATSSADATRSELPRTGFDAPVVALLGIGLLAAGVGLRLRVAHGRRS